ncbi:hypothetical protein [Xylocopilactobacillus apis]|uniref:Uncharacterized protein n=1 Tax=Xylocopilactobacillus apis TaxID=2932183 RepID=A0AAU9CRN4_9LACO|nr:hypothetical protein [Xylocopilactobacillus apis]BDR56594.1 hypothetical protein KIMC2_11560 [Xylocopilactobacillus apis]
MYNINVELPLSMITTGYIICQQFRTIDPSTPKRETEFIETAPDLVVSKVLETFDQFINP